MPALWPIFITNLANDIAGQSFTKPGGAGVSYELPKVGTDQIPIFPPSKELIESIKPGNPANSLLTTDPTSMVNAINLNPLSGRYDLGVRVAERYIEATKGLAMTPYGATHTNNPAAELLLKQGYGLIFERMLKEGDIPLMDQKDENGAVVKMGKESHPAYSDFCPDPIPIPDPIEEQKKQEKKFNKFITDNIGNLHKFKCYEFHCIDGTESLDEMSQLLANRMLQEFQKIDNGSERWNYFTWVNALGKEMYTDLNANVGLGFSNFRNLLPYPNISNNARNQIRSAGYEWDVLVESVRSYFIDAVLNAFPPFEKKVGDTSDVEIIDDWELRIKRSMVNDIVIPWPFTDKESCPLYKQKMQVTIELEQKLPDNPSKKPFFLKNHIVSLFSYDNSVRQNIAVNTSNRVPYYKKDFDWIIRNLELPYKQKWTFIPSGIKNVKTPDDMLNLKGGGTIFKFQQWQVKEAKEVAEECDSIEDSPEIDHNWPGGDPYEEMAEITIAYWYACLVKPFTPSPSALPAIIPPPLTGIYIPIYYGGKKRLANNLRKAWNSGKSFSKLPVTQPPALAVSTALSAAYALHLLEFKLLYLGGIPTPVGPIPMVGFVPLVF